MFYLRILFIFLILPAVSYSSDPYRAVVDEDGVQRVEIVAGGGYLFTPDHIILKVNVPVELKVRQTSWLVSHNIVVNEPEAGLDFSKTLSSEPKIIKFTPIKTGRYTFYCDKRLLFFKSHRDRGMEGVFEVVE